MISEPERGTTAPDQPQATPLRHDRNFRLLWIGGLVSALGTRASSLAYPLLVLALGGTAADAGWVGFAAAAPYLVLPVLLGPLVDRWDRRRVMIAADAGRLAAMLTIVAALSMGTHAAGAAHRGRSRRGCAASRTTSPNRAPSGCRCRPSNWATHCPVARPVVEPDSCSANRSAARAVRVRRGGRRSASTHSPTSSPSRHRWACAAVSAPRPRPRPASPAVRCGPLFSELGAGIVWLWRQRFLRAAAIAIAASNMLFQALTLVVVVAATGRHVSSAIVGLLFVGAGIGGVLGSLASSWCAKRMSLAAVVIGVNWAGRCSPRSSP